MKPPAPRDRECDAIRLPRSQLQIAHVLLRVAGDLLDLVLHQNLARNGLLARVTDHSVAERFANVEKEFVAFLLRVLDVLFVPHQLRGGVDHVRSTVEHRQVVGIE